MNTRTIKDVIGDQLVSGQTAYTIENNILSPIALPKNDYSQRLVCLFSCGSTSYVATKMALEENKKRWHLPALVIYTMVVNESADNLRFLQEAQSKLGIKVIILINHKFNGDIYEVQRKRRYIAGIQGAPCTMELKWRMRKDFVNDSDVQVFGFQAGEEKRMDDFAIANPTTDISCPLICNRITKQDAFNIIVNDGLRLPASYQYFANANCVGCVKGQAGYWNEIRKYAVAVFKKQGGLEREFNASINKKYKVLTPSTKEYIDNWLINDGKKPTTDEDMQKKKNVRLRVFLDQLEEGTGRYKKEPLPECGVLCELEQGLNADSKQ